jgi:hypothetical protein
MMTLNEIRYNPTMSTFLQEVGLALRSSHTQKTCCHVLYQVGDLHTMSSESGVLL